ncbi:MAG: Eco57I restriction-modification methylase domain-containing [Methanobrevibacter sp. CfCl-M3]
MKKNILTPHPTTHLTPALQYKLIYVYTRPDAPEVEGQCKIGDATLELPIDKKRDDYSNSEFNELLKDSANKRIHQQLATGAVKYKLEHYELAIVEKGDSAGRTFRDHQVHKVLLRSGIKKAKHSGAQEWFKCTVEQAKQAISCVKNDIPYFSSKETKIEEGIVFRKEQAEFIKKVNGVFKKGSVEKPKKFLGNLKMRFGKTLCTLEIARTNPDIHKVLIMTHRPVVNDGWFDDFKKLLANDEQGWQYGSKDAKGNKGATFKKLKTSENFIYFASIQDLRGSFDENGDYTKNADVFGQVYDMVVVDEAHEGTLTNLAEIVDNKLSYRYKLHLSGTPFNLVEDFKEEETSTWDYVDEQDAKKNWGKEHIEQSNPYEDLPELKMFTYNLTDAMKSEPFSKEQGFRFKEFFRTDSDKTAKFKKGEGKDKKTYQYHPFIYKKYITTFLNLISHTDVEDNNPSYFPYSNADFAKFLKNTLWLLPGVEECKALEAALAEHVYFRNYTVVNAAGDGTYEDDSALEAVKNEIGEKPEEAYTITLSCGKLTTGVTVPAWTGVLMLSNITSPSLYLQTAFRCQTPASFGEMSKTCCYLFDFDPDRALSMAVAANQISKRPGEGNDKIKRAELKKFLDYCPIIAVDGAKLEPYDVDSLMHTLKRIYIEKTINEGFDTPLLYNRNSLLKLTANDIEVFNNLKTTVGSQQSKPATKDVQVVKHDLANVSTSASNLIEQGREIIENARSRKYKNPVSEELLSEAEKVLADLETVVQKVKKFSDTYKIDNFDKLSPKVKDKYNSLSDDLGVAYGTAQDKVQQIINAANAKVKLPPSPEDIERKKQHEQAKNAEAILRAVSVRIPLLVLGCERPADGEKITLDNFAELIDDESWEEFMPKGFLKISKPPLKDENQWTLKLENGETIQPGWDYVKQFFDKDIFEGSCKEIQNMVEVMDSMAPLERLVRLVNLFNTFKNPDKETVLTPWRVVNMHAATTIGGLRWVDETGLHGKWWTNIEDPATMSSAEIEATPDARIVPKWIDSAKAHDIWSKSDLKVLDPNSKTCLYPLYMAASIYVHKLVEKKLRPGKTVSDWFEVVQNDIVREDNKNLWKQVVEENIFVNTRVKFSAKIARRVLCGYSEDIKANISTVDLMECKKLGLDFGQEISKQYGSDNNLAKNEEKDKEEQVKFDVIIGNPPYQENDNGKREESSSANASASPLYNLFVDAAKEMQPRFISMIMPSRWQAGGKGLDGFRKEMLKDRHICVLHDFPDESQVFTDVSIKGGVCYFLRDGEYKGKCDVFIHSENEGVSNSKRFLDEGDIGVFIRDNLLISINKRVWGHQDLTGATSDQDDKHRISSIVSVGKPYGLRTDTILNPAKYGYPKMHKTQLEAGGEGSLEVFGLIRNKRVKYYAPANYPLQVGLDAINTWKVFVPEAYGCGAIGETIPTPILGTPILGTPIQICTETFLRFGNFKTKFEASSALKYLKTKFFRALVGIRKITQHTTKKVYTQVPIQNFTPHTSKGGTSDIDWSRPIPEIDQQLYKKYGLTKKEIDFIEDKIKPMK